MENAMLSDRRDAAAAGGARMKEQFLISLQLLRDRIADPKAYPFAIPAFRKLERLEFASGLTILVGENGSGKSTLIEAIAVAIGLNAEGGSQNFNFSTRATHSKLHEALRIARGTSRPRESFFLRAESLYNVASQIEELGIPLDNYGGKSLHAQSHGESFLSVMKNRFGPKGLYLLDEPESALSPARQLACLRIIHDLIKAKSQFVIATHSPILMAYPGATIFALTDRGIRKTDYESTEHYRITRMFLERRQAMLQELFAEEDAAYE
jgi:predicted ATPase